MLNNNIIRKRNVLYFYWKSYVLRDVLDQRVYKHHKSG